MFDCGFHRAVANVFWDMSDSQMCVVGQMRVKLTENMPDMLRHRQARHVCPTRIYLDDVKTFLFM